MNWGGGGMGIVYHCLDTGSDIEVAVKTLPPMLAQNAGAMEEVKANFKLVADLIHQNIAASRFLESNPHNDEKLLVMEYVNGESLKSWLRKRGGTVELSEALLIIRQVAAALDFAHGRRVMHRDIKPSNVMVIHGAEVKLLDFGLAAQIRETMVGISNQYHGTSGTGPYMAPEQWRGKPQDARTDQYALAVLLYEMLTGHPPFMSHDLMILREAVLAEPPDRPEGLTESGWWALRKALAKDRSDRHKSCGTFAQALNATTPAEPKTSASDLPGDFPRNLPDDLIPVESPETISVVELAPGSHDARQSQADFASEKGLPVEARTQRSGIRFRLVPPVSGTIGSPEAEQKAMVKAGGTPEWYKGEVQVNVSLTRGMYVGKYPVTREEWQRVMGSLPPNLYFKHAPVNAPVERVSWNECAVFCNRLSELEGLSETEWVYRQEGGDWGVRNILAGGYRMLTEAEWELSCRAGTKTSLYNGEIKVLGTGNAPLLGKIAWYSGNAAVNYKGGWDSSGWEEIEEAHDQVGVQAVGGKFPNAYGLYDMLGNVSEWTSSGYGSKHQEGEDPFLVPTASGRRVYRGGSWLMPAWGCRSADRVRCTPEGGEEDLGFRLVRVLPS